MSDPETASPAEVERTSYYLAMRNSKGFAPHAIRHSSYEECLEEAKKQDSFKLGRVIWRETATPIAIVESAIHHMVIPLNGERPLGED